MRIEVLMNLYQYKRQYGNDESAGEIAIKNESVFNRRNSGTAEAFSVNTEKITFLALVYADRHQRIQSTGFVVFAGGEKWHFFMDEREEPDVREKCRAMAQRIARMYKGSLAYGIVDGDGAYRPQNI